MRNKYEGMCILEQVEEVKKDMEQLVKDIINTDVENIDIQQLKEFSVFCKNYSIEIQESLKILKENVGE